MPSSESFLNRDPEELEQFLLQLARQDVAPPGARERTLASVASAAASAGLLAGAAGYGSRSSLVKATTWLAAKWLTAGLSAGLLTLSVAQGVTQLAQPKVVSAPSASARVTLNGGVPASAALSGSAPSLDAARDPSPATRNSIPGATDTSTASSPDRNSVPAQLPAGAVAASLRGGPARGQALAPELQFGILTQELLLLESARSALSAHAPAQALHSLDDYAAGFPSGSLQIEAGALRVEAVAQRGNRALAQRLGESFLSNHPTSPLAARVRALLLALRPPAQKP